MMFLYTLAAAAVAYLLGSGSSRRMQRRIEELERKLGGARAAEPPSEPAPAPIPAESTPAAAPASPADEVTPEVVAVISAAVAAFLGKKARVKRVRRLYSTGTNPWTQQGRVYIQGSHNLATRRGGE